MSIRIPFFGAGLYWGPINPGEHRFFPYIRRSSSGTTRMVIKHKIKAFYGIGGERIQIGLTRYEGKREEYDEPYDDIEDRARALTPKEKA